MTHGLAHTDSLTRTRSLGLARPPSFPRSCRSSDRAGPVRSPQAVAGRGAVEEELRHLGPGRIGATAQPRARWRVCASRLSVRKTGVGWADKGGLKAGLASVSWSCDCHRMATRFLQGSGFFKEAVAHSRRNQLHDSFLEAFVEHRFHREKGHP